MRKTILIFSCIVVHFVSCEKAKKNMVDYYPKVSTVSASFDENGNVTVEGIVDLTGETVYYAGFCVDTVPDPEITKSQRVIKLPNSSTFTTSYQRVSAQENYREFKRNKTYYFKSWAGNNNGLSYGNVIALSNIRESVKEPPCLIDPESIDLGLGLGSSAVFGNKSYFDSVNKETVINTAFNTATGSGTLSIRLNLPLEDGQYNIPGKTCNIEIWGPEFVSIMFENKFPIIYVSEKPSNNFEITICDLSWRNSIGPFYHLKTRFTVPK